MGNHQIRTIPLSCFITKISKFRQTNKSFSKKIISWDLLFTFIGHCFYTDDTRLVVGSGIEPLAHICLECCSTRTELPLPKNWTWATWVSFITYGFQILYKYMKYFLTGQILFQNVQIIFYCSSQEGFFYRWEYILQYRRYFINQILFVLRKHVQFVINQDLFMRLQPLGFKFINRKISSQMN